MLLRILILAFLIHTQISYPSISSTPYPFETSQEKLIINNRPLFKIHGKMISLLDVVKKMDLLIYEHHPEIISSPRLKYQFYLQNWLLTLKEMIHTELILADAKAKKITISNGDIREEMLERFGSSSIIQKIHNLNLSYEEMRNLIHEELILKKMKSFKIYSKIMQMVTPDLIQSKYREYCSVNIPLKKWKYRFISLRGQEEQIIENCLNKIYILLKNSHSIDEIADIFQKENPELCKKISIHISPLIDTNEKTISQEHYIIISSMKPTTYSKPCKQISRIDGSTVHRIFYLISEENITPPLFSTVSQELRNALLNQLVIKETQSYIETLSKRFNVDIQEIQDLKKDFQPFILIE